MNWLIIGYGNPSRQDDGVGHWVVNRLNEAWGLPTYGVLGEPGDADATTVEFGDLSVKTLWLQQLDVGLAEEFSRVDKVLLIDAHVDGERRVDLPVGDGQIIGVTSHVASPETLVAIADAAYGQRPEAMRHSVRGEQFDFATGLSPEVEAAAGELVDEILAEVAQCMS